MASYYRSRSPGDPLIYVQEEGRWRSYAADGVIAEEGDIPDEVLAGLEEIPPDEAALVIGQMAPDAEGWKSERTVYSMPEDRAEPQAAGRRSILRRRGIQAALAIVGIIVVIAIAVAVVESCDSGGVAGPDGTSPTGGSSTSGSSTVAKVGKRSVTKEELDRRVADFEAQYPGQTPDPQAAPEQFREFQLDVLDYLITYELAKQKAKALDVTVTEEEVQSQIDSILETSFGGDQAAFDQALARGRPHLRAGQTGLPGVDTAAEGLHGGHQGRHGGLGCRHPGLLRPEPERDLRGQVSGRGQTGDREPAPRQQEERGLAALDRQRQAGGGREIRRRLGAGHHDRGAR